MTGLEVLHSVSLVLAGLFSGSLLTEAVILVPYWRKVKADDFFDLHPTMGPVLFKYFAPLTTLTVFVMTANMVWAAMARPEGYGLTVAAGLLMLAVFATFFLFFKSANQAFADRSIPNDALPGLLRRWAIWHNVRTAMAVFAFGLLAVAA